MTPQEMIAAINAAYPECQYVSLNATLTDYHHGDGPELTFSLSVQPGLDGLACCSMTTGKTLQAVFAATMAAIRERNSVPDPDDFAVFVDSITPPADSSDDFETVLPTQELSAI